MGTDPKEFFMFSQRSITDNEPKVKSQDLSKNEVHTSPNQKPAMVPWTAYQQERARRIQAEKERDQYRSLIYNTKLNPQERIYTIGIIDAVKYGRFKDEQGRTRINQEGIAERLGVQRQTIASARKMLGKNLIKDTKTVKVDGETYRRVFISLDEEIVNNPSKIERAEPRKIKEHRRYRCQKCDSENITIRTTKTIICNCCRHESLLDETYQEQKDLLEEEEDTSLCVQNLDTYKNQIPPPEVSMCTKFRHIGDDKDDIPQPDQFLQIDPLIIRMEAAKLLVAIAGDGLQHIGMNRRGENKYRSIPGRLTLDEALEHLQGKETYGAFCSRADGLTRSKCWDVDSPDEWVALQSYAQALVEARYFPILEESPAGRGGHLWIIFDELVDAAAASAAIHAIVPALADIKEYWPAPEHGKGNRVRLPAGKYLRTGINEWCKLISVVDGEISTNGDEAAQLLITHQTPASIIPSPDPDDDQGSESEPEQGEQPPIRENSDQEGQNPVGIRQIDAQWEQKYGQTPEGKRLWFAWTDEYLMARFNARNRPEDLISVNRQGKALATWRGERTASVAIHGEKWTDFGASARRPDGSPDSGDAFELSIRLSGKSKRQALAELGKALLQEVRRELEHAAKSGKPIPGWIEEIITPAGRAHYNQLRYGSQPEEMSPAESDLPPAETVREEQDTKGGVSGFKDVEESVSQLFIEPQKLSHLQVKLDYDGPISPPRVHPICHPNACWEWDAEQGYKCSECG
jgi:hypothetical protein